MTREQKPVSISGMILLSLVLMNTIIMKAGLTVNAKWYLALAVTLPLLLLAIGNVRQK